MDTIQVRIVKILSYANGVVELLGVHVVEGGVSMKFTCVPLATLSVGDVLTVPNPMEAGAVLTNTLDTPMAIYTLSLSQLDLMSRSVEGFNWEVASLAKEREEAEKSITSLVMKSKLLSLQPGQGKTMTDHSYSVAENGFGNMVLHEPGISLANKYINNEKLGGVRRGEAIIFGGGNTGSGSILNDNAQAADIPEPPELGEGLKVYMEAFSVITSDLIKIIIADVNRTVSAANLLTYINWCTKLVNTKYSVVFTSNVIPFDVHLVALDRAHVRLRTFISTPSDSHLITLVTEIRNFIEHLPHAQVSTTSN